MEIKNLQIIRGIAALLVVISHFFGSQLRGFSPYVGHMGVDIFFTLSGFLMVYCQNDNKGAKEFFVGRVMRIYPAYIIISLPMLISAYSSIGLLAFIGNLLLLPGLNDPDYTVINYPAWTLVYEMIFYVMFSFSLFFSRKKSVTCLLTVFMIIISIYLFSGKYDKQGWVNLGYILGDQLMLNFAVGCLIGLIHSKVKVKYKLNFYMFVILSIVAMYIALKVLNDIRIIKLGVPSFFILLLAIYSKPLDSKLYKFMYLIGGASFSIYLSHIYLVNYHAELTKRKIYTESEMMLITCGLTIFSVMIGVFLYKFVEKPISKKIKEYKKFDAMLPADSQAEK